MRHKNYEEYTLKSICTPSEKTIVFSLQLRTQFNDSRKFPNVCSFLTFRIYGDMGFGKYADDCIII